MCTILNVKDVTKIYTKGQKPSLNKVSFDVMEGEFIGIMGASGSGKTTLLNVLSTIDKPSSGAVNINNVNIKTLNDKEAADFRKNHLGFIFQEYFLLDSLTIHENISVPLTLQKLTPKEIERKVKSLAERFGIASQLNKYPNELSGGQRQRASAARALDCIFATIVYKAGLMQNLLGNSMNQYIPVLIAILITLVIYAVYYLLTVSSCYKVVLKK